MQIVLRTFFSLLGMGLVLFSFADLLRSVITIDGALIDLVRGITKVFFGHEQGELTPPLYADGIRGLSEYAEAILRFLGFQIGARTCSFIKQQFSYPSLYCPIIMMHRVSLILFPAALIASLLNVVFTSLSFFSLASNGFPGFELLSTGFVVFLLRRLYNVQPSEAWRAIHHEKVTEFAVFVLGMGFFLLQVFTFGVVQIVSLFLAGIVFQYLKGPEGPYTAFGGIDYPKYRQAIYGVPVRQFWSYCWFVTVLGLAWHVLIVNGVIPNGWWGVPENGYQHASALFLSGLFLCIAYLCLLLLTKGVAGPVWFYGKRTMHLNAKRLVDLACKRPRMALKVANGLIYFIPVAIVWNFPNLLYEGSMAGVDSWFVFLLILYGLCGFISTALSGYMEGGSDFMTTDIAQTMDQAATTKTPVVVHVVEGGWFDRTIDGLVVEYFASLRNRHTWEDENLQYVVLNSDDTLASTLLSLPDDPHRSKHVPQIYVVDPIRLEAKPLLSDVNRFNVSRFLPRLDREFLPCLDRELESMMKSMRGVPE